MKNLLPDSNDTKAYEKWIKTKSLRSLKRFLSFYTLDVNMSTNKYTNVKTRIHLITNEIKKRESLKTPDTIKRETSDMEPLRIVCEALISDTTHHNQNG